MTAPPENDLRDAVADILLQELIVRRGYDSVGRAADWIDGKDIAADRILSGPLAKARADLERVTAERDAMDRDHTDMMWQRRRADERADAAEAENTRLRALLVERDEALRWIADSVPATCDMTLAHDMAGRALAALDKASTTKEPA